MSMALAAIGPKKQVKRKKAVIKRKQYARLAVSQIPVTVPG
jgi:hypothetical protein